MADKALDAKHEKILRALQKLPDNKKCFNCDALGTTYIVPQFAIFVCTDCSGKHMQFGQRVKSVSMGKFSPEEIKALEEGGNERCAKRYLAKAKPDTDIHKPYDRNPSKVQSWIRTVFVEKSYYLDVPLEPRVSVQAPPAPSAIQSVASKGMQLPLPTMKAPPPTAPAPATTAAPAASVPSLSLLGDLSGAAGAPAKPAADPFGDFVVTAQPTKPVQAAPVHDPFSTAAAIPAPTSSFDPFAASAAPAVTGQSVTSAASFDSFQSATTPGSWSGQAVGATGTPAPAFPDPFAASSATPGQPAHAQPHAGAPVQGASTTESTGSNSRRTSATGQSAAAKRAELPSDLFSDPSPAAQQPAPAAFGGVQPQQGMHMGAPPLAVPGAHPQMPGVPAGYHLPNPSGVGAPGYGAPPAGYGTQPAPYGVPGGGYPAPGGYNMPPQQPRPPYGMPQQTVQPGAYGAVPPHPGMMPGYGAPPAAYGMQPGVIPGNYGVPGQTGMPMPGYAPANGYFGQQMPGMPGQQGAVPGAAPSQPAQPAQPKPTDMAFADLLGDIKKALPAAHSYPSQPANSGAAVTGNPFA